MLAIIPRLVRRNPENPRLKLAVALERIQVLDDGKKNFLADFLRVLRGEIMAQLENEAARRRVMPVEQFVPGLGVALATAPDQFAFRVGTHWPPIYRRRRGGAIQR